ncbi:MAG: methylated-DNA--[protein]-cysteine S-methyltransferase [Oxalobacter formigenes]|nr:methylated-DNA--[protein]-cysteine S-methyltransferase [Oxalobacter formigenes]
MGDCKDRRRHTIDRRIQRYLHVQYEEGTSGVIEQAMGELNEYFAGWRETFDVPVVFTVSAFQCAVWEKLMKIPCGMTISYGELARRIYRPKAVRAVASANATNPISIFVPCHRVIGSNHKLAGYGSGLDAKIGLLELECAKTAKSRLW